ncbi:MAG: marine proteobacterial sortase target protein [Betaproteobacteria bacterium]|nr:marine proteobacterial sortase target protein [Betaproteobacteria bacterium]
MALPNGSARTRGKNMASKAGGYRGGFDAAAVDFLELLGKAILSGIAVSLALALVALGLATSAQAQTRPNDAKTGTLLFRVGDGAFLPAPKVETEVMIHVTGVVARTRVTQTFHNAGTDVVEGLYVFPLPENAAVDRLRLRIGDRLIEGQVREKEEARRVYAQARSEGKKAALVEQQRPNLFTNAVANIGPGEFVRVLIEYQQTLSLVGDEYRVRFPLAVTPRYHPAGGTLPEEPRTTQSVAQILEGTATGELLAETVLHPDYVPAGANGVNPVAIGVVIDFATPLARVTSSYHEAFVDKDSATRTVVYLQKEQEEADRDFELVWSPLAGAAPQAAVFTESRSGTDYSLLMVMPPQPSAAGKAAGAAIPRETVFVIDTSGSMQGTSIQQAKQALLTGLSTLSPRDRFNVVEFNSSTRPMWPAAMPATADNLRFAQAWVARLRADGGTEMAGALTFALDGRDTPGYLRQVIFMTDGAVGNEDQLFKLIAQRLGATRLFTVGIGSAPNSHFMTKAAQFGRGTFTYIGDLREVQEKMASLFARIESPVLKDVSIRWPDGTPVETFPPRVPDLYLGEPIVVAAAHASARGTIVVSGQRGNEPWSVALTPSPSGETTGVGALWARAKIASLMDELRLGADEAAIRPAVVKVALEHHLVSRYTSLVAVDVTPTVPAGQARTAIVKASAPHGMVAGQLPQTDTESTLQILLGLLALAAAGTVALVGRIVPAGGVARVEAAR